MKRFARYGRPLLFAAAVMAVWLPGCAKRLRQEPARETSELIPYKVSSSDRPLNDGAPVSPAPVVYDTLTDARDGKTYRTVKIGGRTWMADNLSYQTEYSYCYGNDGLNCDDYGRLYGYEAATEACPPGWRLPSRGEWDSLGVAVGGTRSDGDEPGLFVWKGISRKLKARDGWKSHGVKSGNGYDHYGFSALPGGGIRGYTISGSFARPVAGFAGVWRTATEAEDRGTYIRIMVNQSGDVTEAIDEGGKFSVRCVKDGE
jgi:uncharacterized protein (TIGR02145 family)